MLIEGNRELDMTKKLTFNEAQKAFTDLLENVHPSGTVSI